MAGNKSSAPLLTMSALTPRAATNGLPKGGWQAPSKMAIHRHIGAACVVELMIFSYENHIGVSVAF
jgi:hypothetical protein